MRPARAIFRLAAMPPARRQKHRLALCPASGKLGRMNTAEANTILAENFADWVRALEPRVTEIGPDRAVLEIPVTPAIARVGGIVSGQALATLADTAMVFACIGHAGRLELVSTVTLDTQFLRAAKGDSIRATAEVTKSGRGMIFARASLTALPDGREVALATATFARPPA